MTYKRGFTLIEVLTALFIVAIGLSSVFGVINRVLNSTSNSVNRMTASYLAQEGVEIVRNIRDSNWLADRSGDTWTNNMRVGNSSEGDYNDSSLIDYTDRPLEISHDGFYENSRYTQEEWDSSGGSISGYSQSIFKRRITVTTIDSSTIRVEVKIEWEEKNKNYNVIVEEELNNWI
jgi:type IV pilus modification protein PilV